MPEGAGGAGLRGAVMFAEGDVELAVVGVDD